MSGRLERSTSGYGRRATIRPLLAAAMLIGLSGSAGSWPSGTPPRDPIRLAQALGPARQLCIGDEAECARRVIEKLKRRSNIDLTVNFEYDSAILTEAARSSLDQLVVILKDSGLSSSSFVVEGHTDAKGRPGYNLELSKRRAAAVVDYLDKRGIDTARFSSVGYGSLKPISGDPFADANRRVEMRLQGE